MMVLTSVEQLAALREELKRQQEIERKTSTIIRVGMGTCGIAAGARETFEAIEAELSTRCIDAKISAVGCLGVCSKEPLIDICQASSTHVLYANITADKVPQLIEEHLVNGRPIKSWVIGRMTVEN